MQLQNRRNFIFKALRYVVAACFTSAICSVELIPAQAQPLPERRPLTGRVLATDNTPIKGATVTIRQQTDIALATFWGARVATDGNGEFSFADAEEGAYYITVSNPGFAPVQSKSHIVDSTTLPLVVTLERLATLPLRILKPDNSALAGTVATVRLVSTQTPSQPLIRVTTDAAGNASLPGLMPGSYTVQVLAENTGVVTLRDVDVRYAAEPKTLEARLQAGGTLRVVAKESQTDKEPRPFGGATITFATVASEGDIAKPTGNANLPDDMMLYVMQSTLSMPPGSPPALVTRDGDGILQIADLTPGTYTVRLFSPLHKQVAAQTVEIKAGQTASAEFVAEATSPPATLDVLVRDIKDKPIADTEFTLRLSPTPGGTPFGGGAPPPAPEVPAAIRNLFGTGNFVRRARSDKDGKITLYPVQPGKWRVTIMVPPKPDGSAGSAPKDVAVTVQGGSVTIPVTLPAPAAKP